MNEDLKDLKERTYARASIFTKNVELRLRDTGELLADAPLEFLPPSVDKDDAEALQDWFLEEYGDEVRALL
jgi:hypothetical protein